jgi:ribosomal protein L13E
MLKDKKINRIKQVEMSPEAIDRRLLDLAQLYKLGMTIQNARRLGKVNEIRSLESLENEHGN